MTNTHTLRQFERLFSISSTHPPIVSIHFQLFRCLVGGIELCARVTFSSYIPFIITTGVQISLIHVCVSVHQKDEVHDDSFSKRMRSYLITHERTMCSIFLDVCHENDNNDRWMCTAIFVPNTVCIYVTTLPNVGFGD
jgi:hypothetical protein